MMEETVLLNFEIDQGQAEKELIAVNKAILNNKEAAQELTKAYKAGELTQEEYVKENIILQQHLKKNQQQSQVLTKVINSESNSRDRLKLKVSQLTKEYDNLNLETAEGIKRADQLEKELSQLNQQLTKGNKAAGLFKNEIGNYPDAFKNAASSINVAGVSVGDVGSKLAAFANPATAAVGIVTALGAAYAKSTIGAKDLEFATNNLASTFGIAANKFASFISSSEDGEGAISQLTTTILGAIFGLESALKGREIAKGLEELEDLQREEIILRDKINERLETNQELLTDIQDEQVAVNDKIFKADQIVDNLRANESDILDVKSKQLSVIEKQLAVDINNEDIQTSLLEKQREISNIERDTTKQVEKIVRLKDNLVDAENKRLALLAEENRLLAQADARLANKTRGLPGQIDLSDPKKNLTDADKTKAQLDEQQRTKEIIEGTAEFQLDTEKNLNAGLKTLQNQRTDLVLKGSEQYKQARQAEAKADQEFLASTASVFGGLSQLAKEGSEEQKALALTGIAFNTAEALVGGVASAAEIGWPQNLAAIASTVATILANVAQAKSIIEGYAEGGWTGPGNKYDVAGVVHADEYVAPKKVVHMPQAQPHLRALENMRKGYYDGGYVTNRSIADTNNSLITANALKNMPRPVVDVTQITREQNKVEVKQKISTL